MNVERFSFREFDGVTVAAIRANKALRNGKPKEEAPPPPPTFSVEQLKAAEQEAHRKGFLEGEQEGRKQAESEQAIVERKLAETVEKFAAQLQPLFEQYRKMAVEIKQQSPKMALAIARKVAGHALEQHAQAVIDDMAARACETMLQEPKLVITVHDSLADSLTKKLEALAERLQSATSIVVQRDANIAAADCRIEWNQGGMERNTAEIWQQVEKMIAEMTVAQGNDVKKEVPNPVGRDSGSTGSEDKV